MSKQAKPSAVVRTLVLTDLVSSTKLVETLGDEAAHEVWGRHDRLARDLLVECDGREIDKTDGFLMLFERPLDAVRFALLYHRELLALSRELGVELRARAGIHLGEVFLRENSPEYVARGAKPLEVEGLAKPTAARVMGLAMGGQTLVTSGAFDLAKRSAVGMDLVDSGRIEWLAHGPYRFKGVAEPVEVFEVGIEGEAPLAPPAATEKAKPADEVGAPLREGAQVNRRFQILRFLGESADGRAYRAYDRRREGDVLLTEVDLEGEEGRRRRARLLDRIAACEALRHPNLLDVHELDESGDRPLLVGQYVEGKTPAELLADEGRLSNPVLARLFRQICSPLSAAHEKGMIHGDLRLQDIVVDRDGFAYVGRVGIRSAGEKVAPEEVDPDTISPETVKGEPLSAASDIFSLGVIFHRLATGSAPFAGETPHEKMIGRLAGPPKPAAKVNQGLDPTLDRIVGRCLAPAPQRWESARQIEESLAPLLEPAEAKTPAGGRRIWAVGLAAALAAVAALALALWYSGAGGDPGSGEASLPVVAVMPFDNRTGRPSLDWTGDGLSRLIADRLGESKHLRVVSRGRIDALLENAGGDAAKLSAAAGEGGIGYLLSGEILPAGDGVTVAGRLTDTARQEQVASKQVSAGGEEALLEAAEPISLAVRRGLNVPLADEVDVFAADFATRNPDAYEAFVEGMRAWTGFDYDRAEEFFALAVERAPDYKMARFRLASVQAETGRRTEALAEIRKVLQDTGGLTPLQVGYIEAAEAWWSGRLDEAIAIYRRLIEENPYETEARYSLAIVLAYHARRHEEAVAELKRLAQLEPEVHVTWSMLGLTQLQIRDFDGAVQSLQRYVELERGSPNSHELLGDSYRARGDFEKAVAEYEKTLEMDPTFASAAVKLAITEALMGREGAAERRLLALTSDRRLPPSQRIDAAFELVSIRSAQGRFREAAFFLEALEESLAEEQVRAAMGFSTRGSALLELGDVQEAARLIDRAVEASPGVPTRYLFARGRLELERGEFAKVRATAEEILSGALPPENPDRTEEKAAHYLIGLAALGEGKVEEAVENLRRSVQLEGYRYSIYSAALAKALLAAGDAEAALEQARRATQPLDPVDPRLDLEVERRKALLVLAEVYDALGRSGDAKAAVGKFLDLWSGADREASELQGLSRPVG